MFIRRIGCKSWQMRFAAGRWLDVGCSAGFVVKAATEVGFEAFGVDIEADGIAYGRDTLGLSRLACGVLEDQHYPAGHFDVISAYDVIEHVPDLNRFVAELARILAPGGVIDIGTPDIGHWRVPRELAQWNELKPSAVSLLLQSPHPGPACWRAMACASCASAWP